jgi:hypothetical protein
MPLGRYPCQWMSFPQNKGLVVVKSSNCPLISDAPRGCTQCRTGGVGKKACHWGVVGRAIIRKVHPGMVSALGNGGTSNCINSYREDRRIIVRVITRVRFDQRNYSGQDNFREAHTQTRENKSGPPSQTNKPQTITNQPNHIWPLSTSSLLPLPFPSSLSPPLHLNGPPALYALLPTSPPPFSFLSHIPR